MVCGVVVTLPLTLLLTLPALDTGVFGVLFCVFCVSASDNAEHAAAASSYISNPAVRGATSSSSSEYSFPCIPLSTTSVVGSFCWILLCVSSFVGLDEPSSCICG